MIARLRSDVDGANAVEFALVLPILILILFGTMYGASLFNSQQTVTQAAREAARFGATLPVSEFADIDAWVVAVEERALGVLAVDRPLTPGDVAVCVRLYEPGEPPNPNPSPACPDPSGPGGMEGPRVEVTATRGARLELVVAPSPQITLTSTATARYEPDDLN